MGTLVEEGLHKELRELRALLAATQEILKALEAERDKLLGCLADAEITQGQAEAERDQAREELKQALEAGSKLCSALNDVYHLDMTALSIWIDDQRTKYPEVRDE